MIEFYLNYIAALALFRGLCLGLSFFIVLATVVEVINLFRGE